MVVAEVAVAVRLDGAAGAVAERGDTKAAVDKIIARKKGRIEREGCGGGRQARSLLGVLQTRFATFRTTAGEVGHSAFP